MVDSKQTLMVLPAISSCPFRLCAARASSRRANWKNQQEAISTERGKTTVYEEEEEEEVSKMVLG